IASVHSAVVQAQQLTSPEQFFGFPMGADRKLARWDKLVEYYHLLDRQSDRMQVVNLGPTTMGNPFLVLFISSPQNLARLDEFRQMNAKLSDPRGVSEDEIRRIVANGKAVVVQSFGLHSSEVAASQTAAELMYDLLRRTDDETQRIMDHVIAIMIPCFNPDGEVLVTDWYHKYVGTEYEGVGLNVLYHKYVGHDNNRDAFMTNMVESQYAAKILFRDWIPQAYIDHHQMGPYGARIYVPPYAEPIRPESDPLVWREMSWWGAHIAYKEEEAGLNGVVNAAIYSGWGHFGFHWITPFHNIAGMLTESASARLASPLYLHPDQVRGGARGLPEYEAQTTFPNPWPGGWWRVRDIVERQKVAAWAAVDLAARNRETVLWNAYLKARRQTERGAAGTIAGTVAYLISAEQHDPLTATKLVNKLLVQGIEVQRASAEFTHEGKVYGAGSFVVSMAQPKAGVIRYLLGRTFYPDNSYTRDSQGNPIRPYDMSADVMAEFMGLRVDAAAAAVAAEAAGLATVAAAIEPAGKVTKGANGYMIDGWLNDAFRAVNLLWDRNVRVRRVSRADAGVRPGDFVVTGAPDATVQDIARQTGVDFGALASDVTQSSYDVRRLRIGMYQRYYGGNMDEGWTRWLLEQWGFPYKSLFDAEIKAGNLAAKYDVIILPDDNVRMITGDRAPPGAAAGGGGFGGQQPEPPPEFRSGIGAEGVTALKQFVQSGGTVVTFGEAGEFAIEKLEVPIRDVVANLPTKEFWSPGSTLRIHVDTAHPLAFGMPEQALATFLQGNHAYEVVPTATNEKVERIATLVDRDLLQSGWLLGEDRIAKKAAVVAVQQGQGKVVMIGFRAQHRAQTHGTFKLVFNTLVSGPEGRAAAAAGLSQAGR
ncbi:MAG: peptidase M14 family protein, partial [Gemmatimonadetes bacterium]|nr:peptidase M14 family protein [Gemmatimonadota bacterium]